MKLADTPLHEARIRLALLLLLQAGTAPPVTYDTRAFTRACKAQSPEEDAIVVCGRRDKDRYRIPPLQPADEAWLPPARTMIGGADVGIGTQQVDVGGFPSNRVMVGVKIAC